MAWRRSCDMFLHYSHSQYRPLDEGAASPGKPMIGEYLPGHRDPEASISQRLFPSLPPILASES